MAIKYSKSLSTQIIPLLFLTSCAHAPRPNTQAGLLDSKEERLQTMSDRLADQEAEIANLRESTQRMEEKIKKITAKFAAPPLLDPKLPYKKLHPRISQPSNSYLSDNSDSAAEVPPESNGSLIADSRHEPMHFYFQGLEQLKVRDGEGAVKAFNQFLRNSPEHPYADRAQYWISEAYRRNAEWDQAVVASNVLESRYPYSFKIPDVLLTRAEAFERMGNQEDARKTLKDLMARFPNSPSFEEASRRLSVLTISEHHRKFLPPPVRIDD